jgi:hypothetical protein
VKKVDALAENPALMVLLDAEPLLGVQSSETLLQLLENVLIYRGAGAVPRFFGELKIHSSPLTPHLQCAGPKARPVGSIQRGVAPKIRRMQGNGYVAIAGVAKRR